VIRRKKRPYFVPKKAVDYYTKNLAINKKSEDDSDGD